MKRSGMKQFACGWDCFSLLRNAIANETLRVKRSYAEGFTLHFITLAMTVNIFVHVLITLYYCSPDALPLSQKAENNANIPLPPNLLGLKTVARS
jgi:hypothetical protein